jgi:hypothetical protein
MKTETSARRAGAIRLRTCSALAAASLSACVSTHPIALPDLPAALQVPAGQKVSLRLQGEGEQLYICRSSAQDSGGFAWVFLAPKAELRDVTGQVVGRHYGGPTWEARDGSKVQATVVAQDAGPDPHSVPWLLLRATTNTGSGMFTHIMSVQRLHTHGGKPPDQACDAAQLNQQLGSAYTAEYVFYVAAS